MFNKTLKYEGHLKSSLADQDTEMEYDQMRFILNIVRLSVHSLLPFVL